MKKLYFLIAFLASSLMAFGQSHQIAERVTSYNKASQHFTPVHLFSKSNLSHSTVKYQNSATDVTVLNINKLSLKNLIKETPELLEMTIPYKQDLLVMQFYKEDILAADNIFIDHRGNPIKYEPGVYYRGIIKGDTTSIAGISFYKDDVMAVVSAHGYGNIVVGKSSDKKDFIAYSDKNLLGRNPFACEVINSGGGERGNRAPEERGKLFQTEEETTNCVRIYYELGNELYQEFNEDVGEVLNWILGIHNNISTLYSNDGIHTAISKIKVWKEQDPYQGDYQENLYDFRDNTLVFDGDLAHLVKYPSTTSVAFLNSLCTTFNYAYSGISLTYEEVPTYSWTINAMTHEMGHSMGSPHTHDCVWNGNNTAIDGCGYDKGYGGCAGPIPEDGGTIMSYCHLISGVGINFNKGFGPQPAALIRNTVDSRSCLGTECITQSCFSPTALHVDSISEGKVTISWVASMIDPDGYEYYFSTTDTPPTGSGTAESDAYVTLTGLSPGTEYYFWVRSDCGNEFSSWEGPISFCTWDHIPILIDFEDINCLTIQNLGKGNDWIIFTGTGGLGFVDPVAGVGIMNKDSNYAILNTWNVYLEKDIEYQVSYKYGASQDTQKMEVYILDNDQYQNEIKVHNAIYSTPLYDTVFFTVPTTDAYHFAFICTSDANGGRLLLDDIEIDEMFPLPLTLISFNAHLDMGGAVNLDWRVEEEVNVKNYIVERSNDGQNFWSIGDVKASGMQTYSLKDNRPEPGVNYYRLSIVDNDGFIDYSLLRLVNVDSDATIIITPNPTTGLISISGLENGNSLVQVDIYNEIGQKVWTGSISGRKLYNTGIDLNDLVPGTYTVRITNQMEVSTLRLIKQ